MPTYFNYIEREADNYINWADVGRTLSGTIDDIQRVRDEKKQLIEETFRNDLKYINEYPTGEEESLNKWSIKYGNKASEMLRIQNSLLKQGKLNLRDYTSFRQNLTDDTENLYGLLGNLQNIYKEKTDRYKAGESQDLETHEMALLEQYGNLANTEQYINDLTGSVTLGLTEEIIVDGKKVRQLIKDPNKFVTVTGLRAAANAKYDNYNPLGDISKWVESQGEKLTSFRKIGTEFEAGEITEVIDVTGEKLAEITDKYGNVITEFKKAEDNYLNSLLANDYNALAILTNQMKFDKNGKQFKLTYNEKDLENKDYNFILLKRTNGGLPVPDFKPEQTKEAVEWMRGQARVMYDEKVKKNTYTEVGRQPTQTQYAPNYVYEAAKENKTMGDWANTVADLASDNENARNAALEAVKGFPGVDDAYFETVGNDMNVVVIRDGKLYRQPSFKNNKGVSSKLIGRGLITGIFGGKYAPDEFTSRVPEKSLTKSFKAVTPTKKEKAETLVETNIAPNITGDLFKKYANKTVESLNPYLSQLGITLTTKSSGTTSNKFELSYPNPDDPSKLVTKEFKSGYFGWSDNPTEANNQAEAVKTFVTNYISSLRASEKGLRKLNDIQNKLNQKYGSEGELD
jgi:hypothetical protein